MPEQEIRKPMGTLIAIGGAVDDGTIEDNENAENLNLRFFEVGILKRFLLSLKGESNRIEIVTTASKIPNETGQHYIDAFRRLSSENVGVLNIRNAKDCDKDEYIERLNAAEGVLFTGGDQLLLAKAFGNSEFLKILQDRYQNEKFVIAGTSAGAMAMSKHMIGRGSSSEALLKGAVKMASGLSFMEPVIFDTHFIKRGRFGRLCQAVAQFPSCVGIGLGEDAGLLIIEGNHMEAIGSGLTMIIEGDHIKYTNIEEVEQGEPISIENLRVHVLAVGHSYMLSERRIIY